MGVFIDIAVIIIIILCGIIAYHRGFVKTFFGFISTIVAIIIACIFFRSLSAHIKDITEIDEFIINSIVSIGENEEKNHNETEREKDDEQNMQDNNDLINFLNDLPDTINNSFSIEEMKQQTYLNIATSVSDITINVISWIALYVISRFILLVITMIFNGVMNIPILKSINNIAGFVIGIIMGAFRIYFILAIVYFLSTLIDISALVEVINSSLITATMYNSNLLINLIF